jgi:cold shock protein
MATGIVKYFNTNRGFGFLSPDGGGPDIFVHIRSCCDGVEMLPEGARVKFEERASRKPGHAGKTEAVDVLIV